MLLSAWAAAAIGMASGVSGEVHYPRYGCGKGFEDLPFCNGRLPIADRVDDLVQRLQLEEKPLLMVARLAPLGNISRLGIPQYDWGANCSMVFNLAVVEAQMARFDAPPLLQLRTS